MNLGNRKFLIVLVSAVLAWSLAMASCVVNTFSVMVPPEFKQIGFIDFSNWPAGRWYTLEKMAYDWNPRLKNGNEAIIPMGIIHNRAAVVKDPAGNGQALKVDLPKDKFSPLETGAQIFGNIGDQEAVYFGVSLYLPLDFECGREIKIPPGIYGGWKFATGGTIPDGVKIGPSARATLQRCQAKSYIYHLNQSGNNGDGSPFRNPIYGDHFAWKQPDGKIVTFTKGVWHEIMFFLAMNAPGRKNGVYKVWHNGILVLSLDNLELRRVSSLKLNTVGVEIFNGGNDRTFVTAKNNVIYIKNCLVYVAK